MWSPIRTNQRGSEAFDTPKTIYGVAASDFSSQYFIPIARNMAARGREALPSQLDLTGLTAETAEPQMAMRDQMAHSEILRARQRLMEVPLGVLEVTRLSADLAEKPKGPPFVRTLAALPGESEGPLGQAERILDPIGAEVRLAELNHGCSLIRPQLHRLDDAQRSLLRNGMPSAARPDSV